MNETETFRREVSVRLAENGDGRTLVSRLVPYNEVATVSDDGRTTYEEEFLPGSFDAQTRAAHRVKVFLNYRHGQGLQDQVGHAATLDSQDDGLYGELRVLEHPDGDKALALVREGLLDKLSIEFESVKSRMKDGVMQRVKARLVGVALTPEGAYKGAAVLAVREQSDENIDDDDEEIVDHGLARLDPALADSLTRLGLDVPIELVDRVTFTAREWDGSPSRWPSTEAFARSCLVDDNRMPKKVRALCYVPIREPSGEVNIHALREAKSTVLTLNISHEKRAQAIRQIDRLLADYETQPED